MRARLGLILALVLLVTPSTQGAESGAKKSTREAAYVVLLRLRWDLYARWRETGKWPEDDVAANQALDAHVAFWNRKRDAGVAVLAGGMRGEYWDNVALIIFRAPSEEAARALVEEDPAVTAHVFQAQVRGFDVHWQGRPAG
jgi:uncharacterized protein YciI